MNQTFHKNVLGRQDGIALFVTLGLIAVLLTVTLEMNRQLQVSIRMAQAEKERARLLETARSGLNIAMAVLIQDAIDTRVDSLQENWADPEYLKQLVSGLGYDGLDLLIKDEAGKIQVNALIREYPGHEFNPDQKEIWENLLSFFIRGDKSNDERSASEIINCIKDWLDAGDNDAITGITGAESGYYETLTPPYACANREIPALEELFRIKGISPDLLRATDGALMTGSDEAPWDFRLDELFTVFGARTEDTQEKIDKRRYAYGGKININTAPFPVIAALLPPGREDLAPLIDEYRIAKDQDSGRFIHDLTQKGWYAHIAGLTGKENAQMEKKLTYASRIFSIESRAVIKTRSVLLKAVVTRIKGKDGKWACEILEQRIE